MHEMIANRLKTIRKECSEIRTQLSTYPMGRLQICKRGSVFRLFQKTGTTGPNQRRMYLNRKLLPLAKQLAEKEFLEQKLSDLEREEKACSAYLKHFDGIYKSRALIEKSEAYHMLLSDAFQPLSEELTRWEAEPFSSTIGNKDGLIQKAPHGMVRSKSEAIIAWELYEHRIPYRYECDLVTPNGILHPDFTIRHPKTGAVFLWEHFGLMDNPQYVRGFMSKIQIYITLGYVPSVGLITTYETAEHPLSVDYVKTLIRHHFLS